MRLPCRSRAGISTFTTRSSPPLSATRSATPRTTPNRDQSRAGHKSGVIRGDENNPLGDVFGLAEPADWMTSERRLPGGVDVVGREVPRAADKRLLTHIGIDQPGMDRIHPDPVALASEFERRGFGE